MAEMNIWIEIIKIAPTAFIASAVGLISYRQWRTAYEKFMFDLSDRRMKIIDRAVSLVQKARYKSIDDDDFYNEQNQILKDARYLFEDGLIQFLKENFSKIHDGVMHVSIVSLGHYDLENRREIKKIKRTALNSIINFQDRLHEQSKNYVHFHHKRPDSFKDWFKDANRKRLSYGDQYQNRSTNEDKILYQNSQWLIKKNYLETGEFEFKYQLAIEDLLDTIPHNNVLYYDTLRHMAAKNWVDYEEFEDVFLRCIQMNKCLSDKCDQNILERSCKMARNIAINNPIMMKF